MRPATLNGDVMLITQSAAAFGLWTGQPAPLEVMRTQLEASRDEPELPVLPADGPGELGAAGAEA